MVFLNFFLREMADLIFKCVAKRIAFVPRYALRFTTRMHSSMMCSVRCSGRLWAWGCLTGMSAQAGVCLGGMSAQGVSAWGGGGHVCLECLPGTEFLTHARKNISLWTVISELPL